MVFYVVFVRWRDKSYILYHYSSPNGILYWVTKYMHAWGKLEANFDKKPSTPIIEENTDTGGVW